MCPSYADVNKSFLISNTKLSQFKQETDTNKSPTEDPQNIELIDILFTYNDVTTSLQIITEGIFTYQIFMPLTLCNQFSCKCFGTHQNHSHTQYSDHWSHNISQMVKQKYFSLRKRLTMTLKKRFHLVILFHDQRNPAKYRGTSCITLTVPSGHTY